ncbi:hypothetical protein B4Q13_19925, partial [Lacticaseibacillus rhamnosus]
IALPVVFESGWTHFADKPEAYGRYPEALRFLDQIPTVWQQTELVNGFPGESAVFARRNGDRWFVGGIALGSARTMTAPLSTRSRTAQKTLEFPVLRASRRHTVFRTATRCSAKARATRRLSFICRTGRRLIRRRRLGLVAGR